MRASPSFHLVRLLERLEQSLWVFPTLGVLFAVALQQVLLRADQALPGPLPVWIAFAGNSENARSFLSTIATSVLSMTAVVFSITMLVLQLATNQLSPRVTRTFLRDHRSQLTLAVFISTFSFALLALRQLDEEVVPQLTLMGAFTSVVISLAAFIFFIDHMAHSIRASTIIDRVAQETIRSIERLYPQEIDDALPEDVQAFRPEREPDHVFRWEGRSGVVSGVDEESLLALIGEGDRVLLVTPSVGEFVARGSVFALMWGDSGGVDARQIMRLLSTDVERSMHQDAAFGMRQLVDIAERALSPGTNDPTTAVQALDQLHDLLLILMEREISRPTALTDKRGRLRLVLSRPGWASYLSLALTEIRAYGRTSHQVARRMRFLLEDLLERAPESRRGALLEQLELLNEALAESQSDPERRVAEVADAAGQGGAHLHENGAA